MKSTANKKVVAGLATATKVTQDIEQVGFWAQSGKYIASTTTQLPTLVTNIGQVFSPIMSFFDGLKALFSLSRLIYKKVKTKEIPDSDSSANDLAIDGKKSTISDDQVKKTNLNKAEGMPLITTAESTMEEEPLEEAEDKEHVQNLRIGANALIIALNVLVIIALVGVLSTGIGAIAGAVITLIGWAAHDVTDWWHARQQCKELQEKIKNPQLSSEEKQKLQNQLSKAQAGYTEKKKDMVLGIIAIAGVSLLAAGVFSFGILTAVGMGLLIGVAAVKLGKRFYNWLTDKKEEKEPQVAFKKIDDAPSRGKGKSLDPSVKDKLKLDPPSNLAANDKFFPPVKKTPNQLLVAVNQKDDVKTPVPPTPRGRN